MKHTLAVIGVVGALAGCAFARHSSPAPTTGSAVPTAAWTTMTGPTSPVRGPTGSAGLFSEARGLQGPEAAPVGASPPPGSTILLPVPPLPADMVVARPSVPTAGVQPAEHDHGELAAGDVAAAWIAAVYTGRFDDPPSAGVEALGPLAVSDSVVADALATVSPLDVAAGEARWPYIVEITDTGDGWWHAEVLVKATRFGQVGPSSTPIMVRVHVAAEMLVDAWEQL